MDPPNLVHTLLLLSVHLFLVYAPGLDARTPGGDVGRDLILFQLHRLPGSSP
jgi:hypothetical protein